MFSSMAANSFLLSAGHGTEIISTSCFFLTISAITNTKFIIYAIIFGELCARARAADDLDGDQRFWFFEYFFVRLLLIERLSGKFNESNFFPVMCVKQL